MLSRTDFERKVVIEERYYPDGAIVKKCTLQLTPKENNSITFTNYTESGT